MGNAPTTAGFADRTVHLLGQRPSEKSGLTNGIRTRSATFTGSNATHTPWPTSRWETGLPAGYRALFCGLKDRCITLMLRGIWKVVSAPGFAPDPPPSQRGVRLLHHADVPCRLRKVGAPCRLRSDSSCWTDSDATITTMGLSVGWGMVATRELHPALLSFKQVLSYVS